MMTTNDLKDLPDSCPGCGKPLAEWTEGEGRGVIAGGITYCSQECAQRDQAGGERIRTGAQPSLSGWEALH